MIRRDDRVKLNNKGSNTYDVVDKDGNMLIDSKDNYFIYCKNVNFGLDGSINGRYLGNINSDSSLIDNHCRDVYHHNNDGFKFKNGERIRTARMVAINNKSKTIIVIQS